MSERRAIETADAPRAIGPYSQAICAPPGELVFCAGQIALDPRSGQLVSGGIEAETRRVLQNLEAVLAAAGCTMADVVRTTIYLMDLGDFAAVNALYGERFPKTPPARSTVQVAGLPKGARVEIDAIALKR
ncbi:MAG: RidA family protein [Deltaproteobacteria bacterium]|nr:RidA family protein [Deltaproteobacteria bacterium]